MILNIHPKNLPGPNSIQNEDTDTLSVTDMDALWTEYNSIQKGAIPDD